MNREGQLVELVDESGVATGQSTVECAHRAPGLLHRAFSVLLLDPAGRLLLQRRSAEKTRFPLRWANACCGHPAPGVPVATAALRRLTEELSIDGVQLDKLGVYAYQADDPASGRIEREYDHVLLGRVGPALSLTPDPAEVDAVRWVAPSTLTEEIAADPELFAPWLAGVVALLPEPADPTGAALLVRPTTRRDP
jgi:isopentenyl-diphosphate delta-isomerase